MGKAALEFSRLNAFAAPPEDLIIPGLDPGYEDHWLSQGKGRLVLDEPFLKDIMFEGIHTAIDVVKEGDVAIVAKGRRRVFHGRIANERFAEMGKLPLKVKCFVVRGDKKTVLGLSASENAMRMDLSPLDKAREAERLRQYGNSNEEIGIYLGATPQAVSIWEKLLELDPRVLTFVERGEIAAYTAVEFHGLPLDEQYALAVKMLEEAASGKKPTKERAKREVDPSKPKAIPKRTLVKFLEHAEAHTNLSEDLLRGIRLGAGMISPEDAGIGDTFQAFLELPRTSGTDPTKPAKRRRVKAD